MNGRPYQGPVCDANGQQINLLTVQMLWVIILLMVCHILMLLKSFKNVFANPITFQFSSMRSFIIATGSSGNLGYLCQSNLTKSEIEIGCRLGIDAWADIICSGKMLMWINMWRVNCDGYRGLFISRFTQGPTYLQYPICIWHVGWNHYCTRAQ